MRASDAAILAKFVLVVFGLGLTAVFAQIAMAMAG
jgi:hypothetical protein